MRDERTYKIIGAAIEVHKELGSGFLEAVYQEALGKEFGFQGIPFKAQPVIGIAYKGKALDKTYQPDFLCYEESIVEIKAISALSGLEEAQLINYLKATGLHVGLLLNFGSKSLEYKRLVYNLRESAQPADPFPVLPPVKHKRKVERGRQFWVNLLPLIPLLLCH